MGRSRGGLTTKIHALVDANGLPIALKLTEGQAHDGRSAADMLDSVGEGDVLLADRAYDADGLRAALAAPGAWANIKPMPNRKRHPVFSAFLYRYRNLVERFFNTQAVPCRCHPLRQARRQLPRFRPARLNPHLAQA
jgi:transposase